MNNPEKNKPDYFILTILVLVAVAFIFSFYRYYFNLDYYIVLPIECDPISEVCFSDEEEFYHKITAKAYDIEESCPGEQDEDCILEMIDLEKAEKLSCDEDNLEEWEYCTSPEDFADESPDLTEVDDEE